MATALSSRINLRVLGWFLLPLVVWGAARILLVRPAQQSLARAQQSLFDAEREELAAELALSREDRVRVRMQRELNDLDDTAQRMNAAERAAEAQLEGQHHRPDFVLPGRSRPTGVL